MKTLFLIFILLCAFGIQAFCQETSTDSTKKQVPPTPIYRNVIKFNPTPMLIFSNLWNVTLSYERLIKDNQSLGLQLGYLNFQGVLKDTLAELISFTGSSPQPGFNVAFDYRYYPTIRNRRPAPDGVYIGGYLSYYGIRYENKFDVLDVQGEPGNGELGGNMNFINLGFNLGYQFVFWKRLTLDLLLFGPSISYSFGQGELKGDLDQEQIDMIDEELYNKLVKMYPILGATYNEETMSFTNSRTEFGLGFRYSFQIGFHF